MARSTKKARLATDCLAEARYLLKRAFNTRGMHPTQEDSTFVFSGPVGRFGLSFMPGNRRILISHGTFVEPSSRGKGTARKWLRLKEELATEAGVNLLLATVRDDNAAEVHLLQTQGWKRLIKRNTKVTLWGKKL